MENKIEVLQKMVDSLKEIIAEYDFYVDVQSKKDERIINIDSLLMAAIFSVFSLEKENIDSLILALGVSAAYNLIAKVLENKKCIDYLNYALVLEDIVENYEKLIKLYNAHYESMDKKLEGQSPLVVGEVTSLTQSVMFEENMRQKDMLTKFDEALPVVLQRPISAKKAAKIRQRVFG